MLYQTGSIGWVIEGTFRSTILLPGAASWATAWLNQTGDAKNDSRPARISISFSVDDQTRRWVTSIECEVRNADRIAPVANDDEHPHHQEPHGRKFAASHREVERARPEHSEDPEH